MTQTVLATFLAQAVADDEEAGGGCDLAAGLFGPAVSSMIREIAEQMTAPIDMVLHCPACLTQHIDEPFKPGDAYAEHCPEKALAKAWDNPPHRTHLCQNPTCGHRWRPADVATNGVAAVKTSGKDDSPIVAPVTLRVAQVAEVMRLVDVVAASSRELQREQVGRGHRRAKSHLNDAMKAIEAAVRKLAGCAR